MLGSHGLREDRVLEAFCIGGSATGDLKPGLTPADSEVVVGEGFAIDLDSDETQ